MKSTEKQFVSDIETEQQLKQINEILKKQEETLTEIKKIHNQNEEILECFYNNKK